MTDSLGIKVLPSAHILLIFSFFNAEATLIQTAIVFLALKVSKQQCISGASFVRQNLTNNSLKGRKIPSGKCQGQSQLTVHVEKLI